MVEGSDLPSDGSGLLLANESTEVGTHVLATRTRARLAAAARRPPRAAGRAVGL
jgi:hypothetical protein